MQRHEQSFYTFVHKVHSKGEGLFESLMRWIELFLTLMRDGVGDRISLEFLLPHTGPEREDIIREVDAVALYHYKLKVAYEAKLRKRFGRTQGMNDADAEDEATAQLVNGVVRDLSFGDVVEGDADDLAAQEDADEDDDSSDEYESGSGTSSDDSEDEDSDDDDDDASEGSSGGSETERDGTPHPDRARNSSQRLPPAPPPPAHSRSHTIAHPPSRRRHPSPSPSPSQAVRRSADAECPAPVPGRERARTVSLSSHSPVPASSRFKDLPPHPGAKDLPLPPPLPSQEPRSTRQLEKSADRGDSPRAAAGQTLTST